MPEKIEITSIKIPFFDLFWIIFKATLAFIPAGLLAWGLIAFVLAAIGASV